MTEADFSEGISSGQYDHIFETESFYQPDLDFTIRGNKKTRIIQAVAMPSGHTRYLLPITNDLFWITSFRMQPDYYRYLHMFALFESRSLQS